MEPIYEQIELPTTSNPNSFKNSRLIPSKQKLTNKTLYMKQDNPCQFIKMGKITSQQSHLSHYDPVRVISYTDDTNIKKFINIKSKDHPYYVNSNDKSK